MMKAIGAIVLALLWFGWFEIGCAMLYSAFAIHLSRKGKS